MTVIFEFKCQQLLLRIRIRHLSQFFPKIFFFKHMGVHTKKNCLDHLWETHMQHLKLALHAENFHCSCDTEQDLNILFSLINQYKEESFSLLFRKKFVKLSFHLLSFHLLTQPCELTEKTQPYLWNRLAGWQAALPQQWQIKQHISSCNTWRVFSAWTHSWRMYF